jgi:rod shape-determining protein MreC
VIGSSGSEQSRSIYIDKGSADGVKTDQAVITADGVVGKVIDVEQDHTAKVLLVNDESSGVGVVLEKSRLQGILRGTPSGELVVEKILSDESVQPGERVLTSGGDQIFPKGIDVGVITKATPGSDSFLNIRLTPATNLSKLEEVLVVTQVDTRSPSLAEAGGRLRAADILAERLPSVPPKPALDPKQPAGAVVGSTARNITVGNRPSGVGESAQPAAPTSASRQPAIGGENPSAFVVKSATSPKPRADAGLNKAARNPTSAATGDAVKRPDNASPSGASAVVNAAKPATGAAVPALTHNAKSSLTSKPASETSNPAAPPANKSTIPAKSPPGPVPLEDNP